jgi:tRNA threonylcarbamoyladenosine biosynthesis protein TsaB
MSSPRYILGIDTCGPTGSVALGQVTNGTVEILGGRELEGRSYSAQLVAAIEELLTGAGMKLGQLDALVAVNGPGSFTGVRVGLSAVKGLAESAQIPVVAVSRLEVLAWKAGPACSAIDAHRQEVFLRIGEPSRELLAGAEELAALDPGAILVAVCDQAAAELLGRAWPAARLVVVPAPGAADAVHLCSGRVAAADFVDLALLDGHYLRRSDAEIFGAAAKIQSA